MASVTPQSLWYSVYWSSTSAKLDALEPLAQLDRNLTPSAYYRAQEGMSRSLLRVMLHCNIQMLKLVVSELLDHFPEERHTRMVLGQLF